MTNRLLRTLVNRVIDTQMHDNDLSTALKFGKAYTIGSIVNLCNIVDDPSSDITESELFSRILILASAGLSAAKKNEISSHGPSN